MNQQGRPTKPVEVVALMPPTFTGNHALRIVLARADKHNALNPALIFAINAAFDRALRDDSVKAIILAADGRKDFARCLHGFDFHARGK